MSTQNDSHGLVQWHGTTIVGIKRADRTVIAGDGQVSMPLRVLGIASMELRRECTHQLPVSERVVESS